MSYNIYNNEVVVIAVLQTILKDVDEIDLSRISLIVPFLMDEHIVEILNTHNVEYNIDNIITLNRIPLANFNDRFLSLLPVLYRAIGMLLDVQIVSMRNGKLIRRNITLLDNMIKDSQSQRLSSVCNAARTIMNMTNGKNIAKYYELLKIEL